MANVACNAGDSVPIVASGGSVVEVVVVAMVVVVAVVDSGTLVAEVGGVDGFVDLAALDEQPQRTTASSAAAPTDPRGFLIRRPPTTAFQRLRPECGRGSRPAYRNIQA
jgi:hypothetical protein